MCHNLPIFIMNPSPVSPVFKGRVIHKSSIASVSLAYNQNEEKWTCIKIADHDNPAAEDAICTERQNMDNINRLVKAHNIINEDPNMPTLVNASHHILQHLGIETLDGKQVIVTPYCERGDLMTYIMNTESVPLDVARSIFTDLLLAVYTLHSISLVHGDISPENLLLVNTNSITATQSVACKCIDFADVQPLNQRAKYNGYTSGKLGFRPPEVVVNSTNYDNAMFDMWSVGCVLFILLTHAAPWRVAGKNDRHFRFAIDHGIERYFQEICSAKQKTLKDTGCLELLTGLLDVDPTQRFTILDTLQDPWVQGELRLRKQGGV
jgi:serine/threonine protein kinase